MLSKNQVKFIRSLHLKKFRDSERCFLAEGSTLVLDLVSSRFPVENIYAIAPWIAENSGAISARPIPLKEITLKEMEQITALSSPSPVLAIAKMAESVVPPGIGEKELVLMLDDIRDPGNLGTILRIADWFGIGQVICSENSVDLYNPKTVQSTMGSIARVSVTETSLESFLENIHGEIPVYGTFLDGKNIYEEKLSPNGIIVIGNESRGISTSIEKHISHRLHIPSFSKSLAGHAESLNASVATAIVCSEFRRRNLN